MEHTVKIDRCNDVEAITGLGRTTLWRLVKAGQFPAPIQLSQRAVGWKHADVIAWLDARPLAPLAGTAEVR